MPPYLRKRGNVFYVRLGIPEDARAQLGKREFFESLKTSDQREAEIKSLPKVAKWKTQIDAARGSNAAVDHLAVTVRLEDKYSPANPHTGMTGKDHHIDDVIDSHEGQWDARLQKRFRDIAQGRKTPFDTFLPLFLEQWDVEQKTKDMASTFIKRMAEEFESIELVNRPAVFKALQRDKTSNATKQKNYAFARKYWKFLEDMGVVDLNAKNPFAELNLKTSKRKSGGVSRLAYDRKDVERIYEEASQRQDQKLIDLIVMAAYTGARIEELCQLKVDDVYSISGFQVLSIKESKTDAGIRTVPVHPKLKVVVTRLMRDSDDGYLISNLSANKYGDRSNAIGKRFGRLKTALGYGKEHAHHSFRKTVCTLLENAGVPEGVSADIVGHEKKTMTYGLYSAGTSDKKKFEAIKKLTFKFDDENKKKGDNKNV